MIVVRSFRIQNSLTTTVVLKAGSTLIWNNSAWNPPQYFVENNWVVCLLSCISQSGSPFTPTCILTTPKRNCLDQLLMNTISPGIESSLKLCTFIANQNALICWRHSIGNKSRSWITRPQAGIYNHRQNCWEDSRSATYFGLFLGMLSASDINRYPSKSR